MMEGPGGQQMCPVCTLYLRPGMTLHDHLFTHPKDQVIEALVRLAVTPSNTVNSSATINTNSQFTAITYRQFQTLTTSVPEPMMLNPCLVTQSPAFTSGVIRSSVPLLSYPYYPPEQQQSSSNFHDQDRVDSNNTQCSYSYASQTSQTTQTNSSPQVINNSPFQEANCEPVQDTKASRDNYEPSVDPFLNEDNQNENQRDSFITGNSKNIQNPRDGAYMSSSSNNIHKSVDQSVLEDISDQTDIPFEEDDINENAIESLVDERRDNVNEARIDPFEEDQINCVHETTTDPFVNERNEMRIRNEVAINTFVNNVHEENQSDHMEKILQHIETNTNEGNFIAKSPSLSTVISNTHRLIANDPTLDYDHDLRTEEVEEYTEHDYGNISPARNIGSPVSDVSNWSAGSGLRVRRDLSNLEEQGSNCIQYVQQNSNASEYVTSDPYDVEPDHQQSEGRLTNLDTVDYSMVLNYSTNQQLANMSIDDIEGKEDNSMYSAPLNIHSDELMPPRGELSGQESLGATENSVWELNVSCRNKKLLKTHFSISF